MDNSRRKFLKIAGLSAIAGIGAPTAFNSLLKGEALASSSGGGHGAAAAPTGKRYGFVTPDGGSEDVFVHFSAIEMEGYRTLKEGQRVEFEVTEGPRGLHAQNVKSA